MVIYSQFFVYFNFDIVSFCPELMVGFFHIFSRKICFVAVNSLEYKNKLKVGREFAAGFS